MQIPTSSQSGKRIQSVKSTEQLASDIQPVGSFKPTQSTSDIPKINKPTDIIQQQTPEPLPQTAEPMLPNVSNANTSSSASASGHILPDKEDSDSPSLVPGTANRQLPIEENPTMDFLQEPTSQSNLVPTSAEPSQLTSGCKTSDVPVTSIQDEFNSHIAPVSRQSVNQPTTQKQDEVFRSNPRDLTVSAWLNGRVIKLLVDTGAGISVMDEDFLCKLYADQVPVLCRSGSSEVKTVSGQVLPILGTVKVSLGIAGGNYPCEFHVVKNLTYEAVLGRDFLRANEAVIDLKNSTLKLERKPGSDMECSVRAWSTCVIPPRSETIVPACLDTNFPPGVVGFLEASPRLIDRYQLQGAAALVTLSADHTVPFRLINPTRKPVTLYRGATLGNFTLTDDQVQVLSLETRPCEPQQSSQETENVLVDLSDADLTDEEKAALQSLLNEYRVIFALTPGELERTNWVQHHIDTGDHPPIQQRAYCAPAAQKERIEQCIDSMLEQGIIRPSTSAFFLPKKNKNKK